jgi:hypothetical protein
MRKDWPASTHQLCPLPVPLFLLLRCQCYLSNQLR